MLAIRFSSNCHVKLERRGHQVRHFYFAEDIGPKGASGVAPDDPPTLSIEPISMGGYSKTNLFKRRQGDIRYGRVAAKAIAAFAPDIVLSGNTPVEAQRELTRAESATNSAFVFWVQDFFGPALNACSPTAGWVSGASSPSIMGGSKRRMNSSASRVMILDWPLWR